MDPQGLLRIAEMRGRPGPFGRCEQPGNQRYGIGTIAQYNVVMTTLGVAITAACVTVLAVEFLRHRRRALPVDGWAALAGLLVAEGAMFRKIEPVATYFTPIAWTCWIVLADAALRAMASNAGGAGKPSSPGGVKSTALWAGRTLREKWEITLLSVPLWLIFELYNLRLANWTYVGLPENLVARYLGYAWSFATITPGIFVTADLIQAYGWFGPGRPRTVKRQTLNLLMAVGALLLAIPILVPQEIGAYLFALVWLGFILLLDPVNCKLRLPSLVGDWVDGRTARLWSLLVSGFMCGFLWEFWNYWATARWLYVFPIFQEWKIFEMPAPGFLGFPPFALECFAMYVTAKWCIKRKPATTDEHGVTRIKA